jgi:hypothetical protein
MLLPWPDRMIGKRSRAKLNFDVVNGEQAPRSGRLNPPLLDLGIARRIQALHLIAAERDI